MVARVSFPFPSEFPKFLRGNAKNKQVRFESDGCGGRPNPTELGNFFFPETFHITNFQ